MVFDFDKGLLLKLGAPAGGVEETTDKSILLAMRGRRILKKEEVEAVYGGSNPVFEHIQWPKTDLFGETANFYGFNSYFYVPDYVPLLLGVELID